MFDNYGPFGEERRVAGQENKFWGSFFDMRKMIFSGGFVVLLQSGKTALAVSWLKQKK